MTTKNALRVMLLCAVFLLLAGCNSGEKSTTPPPVLTSTPRLSPTLSPTSTPAPTISATNPFVRPTLAADTRRATADEFYGELQTCGLDPYVLANIQYTSGGESGLEHTSIAWLPEGPGPARIFEIKFAAMPYDGLYVVCEMAWKAVMHAPATLLVVDAVERLADVESFRELMWPNGVNAPPDEQVVRGMTGMVDYQAIRFLNEVSQTALVGRFLGEPEISRSAVEEAELLYQAHMINAPDMSFWRRPEIWAQLPE